MTPSSNERQDLAKRFAAEVVRMRGCLHAAGKQVENVTFFGLRKLLRWVVRRNADAARERCLAGDAIQAPAADAPGLAGYNRGRRRRHAAVA